MINETVLRRFLYVGTTLIIIVTLITALVLLPTFWIEKNPGTRPENNIIVFGIYFIMHLLIIAAFVWTVLSYQRGGHIKKGLLFTVAVLLLLYGLLILSIAIPRLGNPLLSLHRLPVLLFICSGCNFITSLIAFLTLGRSRRLVPTFKAPAWILALLIFIVPAFVFGISDYILATQPGTEWRSFIITNLCIITGCFFIVREKPEGLWVFPIIGNAFIILLCLFDIKLLAGIRGIAVWGGWVLSLIVSYKAAQLGNEREAEES